jgi:hypothetical protein
MSEFIEEKLNEKETVAFGERNSEINAYKTEFSKLSKRIKRLEAINIVSLLLLVAILGVSFVNKPNSNINNVQVVSQKELPSDLNKVEIEFIGKQVVDAYNSSDIDSLYSVLGSYAQTMVTVEELEETMKGLEILGNISKYSYTHHEFMGNDDGADWYSLNYIANYSAGNGTLKINLRIADNAWEIVGFYMNIKQLDLEKLKN